MPGPPPEDDRLAGIFSLTYTTAEGQTRELDLGDGTAQTSLAMFAREMVTSSKGGGAGHITKPKIPYLNIEGLNTARTKIEELQDLTGATVTFQASNGWIARYEGAIVKDPGPEPDWTTGKYAITFESQSAKWIVGGPTA